MDALAQLGSIGRGHVLALVRKGLVAQTADTEDQRQKLLSITAAGRAVWKKLPDPIDIILKIAFKDIPASDLATVVRVLSTAPSG